MISPFSFKFKAVMGWDSLDDLSIQVHAGILLGAAS